MAASRSSTERLSRRYPNFPTKCAVIGDSIMRYVHTHFSPNDSTTPCFISYGGAVFSDVPALLEYLPEHVDTLLLHVGTTDILKTGSAKSLDSLREVLQRVRQMHPTIKTLHISLPLPRAPNRRRHDSNWRFVSKFNREVQRFSREARRFCHYGMLGASVFYVEHGFSALPLRRFLAADGLHASFEGVALLAQHTSVQLRRPSAAWRSAPTPRTTTSGDKPTQQRETEERTEPPRALAVTTSPPLPARRYNTRRTYAATTKAATTKAATSN
ncbi:hypothetical protein MTO96_038811 [Rhipicephalus appendiculatus]